MTLHGIARIAPPNPANGLGDAATAHLASVAFGAAALLGAVMLLGACETRTDDNDIKWVSVTNATTLNEPKGFSIGRTKTMAYVDPRTEKDYAAGHIPGAILVPFGELREGAAAPLEAYEVLVVYDTDYDDVVARALSKRLIEVDRWDVYTLTGGLRAWEKGGNEVAYGMPVRTTDDEGVLQEALAKPRFRSAKKK